MFENIYNILSKWISWQKAEVILIGIGLLFGIATFVMPYFQDEHKANQQNESSAVREEVGKCISALKNDIHPNEIKVENVDRYDVRLIKEFQGTVLEYIKEWEGMDSESLAELSMRIKDFEFAYLHMETRKSVLNRNIEMIDSLIHLLSVYGDEQKKDYKVNMREYMVLKNLFDDHRKMLDEAEIEVTTRNLKTNDKYNTPKILEDKDTVMMNEVYKEYYKNEKYLDSIKLMPSYYSFDLAFFRMINTMNKKYMLRIKEYESK